MTNDLPQHTHTHTVPRHNSCGLVVEAVKPVGMAAKILQTERERKGEDWTPLETV